MRPSFFEPGDKPGFTVAVRGGGFFACDESQPLISGVEQSICNKPTAFGIITADHVGVCIRCITIE